VDIIDEPRLLRIQHIVGRPARNGNPAIPGLVPVSKSTWWEGVKAGRYPAPVYGLGKRITAWRRSDIIRLLDEAAAGAHRD
jgi:predicted DNA-binding transcriptional regulator AlpA